MLFFPLIRLWVWDLCVLKSIFVASSSWYCISQLQCVWYIVIMAQCVLSCYTHVTHTQLYLLRVYRAGPWFSTNLYIIIVVILYTQQNLETNLRFFWTSGPWLMMCLICSGRMIVLFVFQTLLATDWLKCSEVTYCLLNLSPYHLIH